MADLERLAFKRVENPKCIRTHTLVRLIASQKIKLHKDLVYIA